MYHSHEARVGSVVVLGVLAAVVTGLFFLNVRLRAKEYQVKVIFENAGGILRGADVFLSGVRIGRVESVTLEPGTNHAEVVLKIEQPYKLRSNYRFRIESGVLLGERYVVIYPPDEEMQRHLAEQQQRIKVNQESPYDLEESGDNEVVGERQPRVEELVQRVDPLMEKFSELVDKTTSLVDQTEGLITDLRATNQDVRNTLTDKKLLGKFHASLDNIAQITAATRRLVADPQVQKSLRVSLARLDSVTAQTDKLLTRVRETVETFGQMGKDNRQHIDETLKSLAQVSQDVAAMTPELRRAMTDPEVQENIRAAIAHLREVSEQASELTARVNQLLQDPQIERDVKGTLAKLNDTMTTAQQTMQNLKDTSEKLKGFAGDEKFARNLKETVSDVRAAVKPLKETSEAARETMQNAKEIADKINQWLPAKKGKLLPSLKVNADLTARTLPTTNRTFNDFNLWLNRWSRHGYWLGIHDIGESDRLTFQLSAASDPWLALRGGVFRSKLGVGADARLGRRWQASVDLYDPNDFRLNLWTAYRIAPRWELMFGLEGVGDRPRGGMGVRVTR